MATDLLSELLVNPKRAETFSMQEWDLLVCQAGHARLLGRLHHLFHANGLGEKVPDPVRWHFEAAARMTSRHKESVKWEAVQIQRALEKVGVPIVLLKGAAYAMCDLPAASGRLFLDIDILVPKPSLSEVETALNRSGWHATHHDEYDQRYYRKWMHELPPLKHLKRQTVLDVHHTILPETARLTPDPHLMILDSVPIEGEQDLYVLSPADMVLHSATHLFHDGELEHGLRDLVDLDSLLRHFSEKDPQFFDSLVKRADVMNLERPLYYALQYTNKILNTPVPEDIMGKAKPGGPGLLLSGLMDSLFTRALKPDHPSCEDGFTGIARWMLYVRSHYLRMPPHLLIPHLLYKAVITPYTEWRNAKDEKPVTNLNEFMKNIKADKQL